MLTPKRSAGWTAIGLATVLAAAASCAMLAPRSKAWALAALVLAPLGHVAWVLFGWRPRGREPTLRQRVTRLRDEWPVTWLGLGAVGAATGAVALLGIRRVDVVVLGLGATVLGSALISLAQVVTEAIVLRIKLPNRTVEGTALACGVPTRIGFVTPRLRFLPLVVVRSSWVEPRANAQMSDRRTFLEETVTIPRRGAYDGIVRRLEVRDVFGLWAFAFEVEEDRALCAWPSPGGLRSMEVARSVAGGDDLADPSGSPEGDRMDLRAYVPGDPVRFILWRVFAKSRQLVVRSPERALRHARKACLYVVTGDGDEAAAGAARAAIESSSIGSEWVLGADGVDEVATNRAAALDVLARSGQSRPSLGGTGLSSFVERHANGAGGRAIVFVPAKPGPWLARVATSAQPRMQILVCADGVVVREPSSALDRWTAVETDSGARLRSDATESVWPRVTEDELNHVLRALHGAHVRLVDRRYGRVMAEWPRVRQSPGLGPRGKARARA